MAADILVNDTQVIITDSGDNQALLITDDASALFYGKSLGLSFLKIGQNSAALNFGLSSNISLAQTNISLQHTSVFDGNSDVILDKNGINLSQKQTSLSVASSGISITDGSNQITLNTEAITLKGNVFLSGYTVPMDFHLIDTIFETQKSSGSATQTNQTNPPTPKSSGNFSERDRTMQIGVTPTIAIQHEPPITENTPPDIEIIPIELPKSGGTVDLFALIYKMANEINILSHRITVLERKQ